MTYSNDIIGQVALVTGGARGIGLAIARGFAGAGGIVIIADRDSVRGELAAEDLRQGGGDVTFLFADLEVPGGAQSMVRSARAIRGRLDCLVNNARSGKRLELLDETEENWNTTLTVNTKAAFFASQEAIRGMAGVGGAIVNIASVAATLVTNESASYHVAKAGILQMTRYLAVAAGPMGVRVNCVLPGLIVQDEHRQRYDSTDNEQYRGIATHYQPLGDVGSEQDIAAAVLFLCSGSSRYVSGASLVVDGAATVQEQFGLLLRQRSNMRK